METRLFFTHCVIEGVYVYKNAKDFYVLLWVEVFQIRYLGTEGRGKTAERSTKRSFEDTIAFLV